MPMTDHEALTQIAQLLGCEGAKPEDVVAAFKENCESTREMHRAIIHLSPWHSNWKSAIHSVESRLAKLRQAEADRERIRKALEPISKYGKEREFNWGSTVNDDAVLLGITFVAKVTVGDFRRAAAALAPAPDAPGEAAPSKFIEARYDEIRDVGRFRGHLVETARNAPSGEGHRATPAGICSNT